METAVAANGHHLPVSTQAGNWLSTLARGDAGRFPRAARADPQPTHPTQPPPVDPAALGWKCALSHGVDKGDS